MICKGLAFGNCMIVLEGKTSGPINIHVSTAKSANKSLFQYTDISEYTLQQILYNIQYWIMFLVSSLMTAFYLSLVITPCCTQHINLFEFTPKDSKKCSDVISLSCTHMPHTNICISPYPEANCADYLTKTNLLQCTTLLTLPPPSVIIFVTSTDRKNGKQFELNSIPNTKKQINWL